MQEMEGSAVNGAVGEQRSAAAVFMRSAVRDLTLTLTRDDARDKFVGGWSVDAGNSLWISGDTRHAMCDARGATGDGEPRIVLCLDGWADRVRVRV